jgi:hypothetical protein
MGSKLANSGGAAKKALGVQETVPLKSPTSSIISRRVLDSLAWLYDYNIK